MASTGKHKYFYSNVNFHQSIQTKIPFSSLNFQVYSVYFQSLFIYLFDNFLPFDGKTWLKIPQISLHVESTCFKLFWPCIFPGKKGKKSKKGQTVSLNDFLANDGGNAADAATTVVVSKPSW